MAKDFLLVITKMPLNFNASRQIEKPALSYLSIILCRHFTIDLHL